MDHCQIVEEGIIDPFREEIDSYCACTSFIKNDAERKCIKCFLARIIKENSCQEKRHLVVAVAGFFGRTTSFARSLGGISKANGTASVFMSIRQGDVFKESVMWLSSELGIPKIDAQKLFEETLKYYSSYFLNPVYIIIV